MRECQVSGCERPLYCRGWCIAHYCRWRKSGDVRADQPVEGRRLPTMERLAKWIDRDGPNGCWLWTGYIAQGGYGRTLVRGSSSTLAHRVVYETLVGPIPKGLELDHLCRVRHCVNPEHLEPVTARENVLRGVSIAAVNAVKTHCPQGHPYSGDNLYIIPSTGGRQCRICVTEALRRHYQRKKQMP